MKKSGLLFLLSILVGFLQMGENCLMTQTDCSGHPRLLDLGRGYYPRYLTSLDCGPHTCLPFSCTPKTYRVKVLKRREIEDEIPDGSLPEPLRESWKFAHVQVSVACVCNLYNRQKK